MAVERNKEELFDQDIGEGINLQLVEGTYISISYSAVLFEPRKFSFDSFASSRKAIIPQGIYEIGKDIPIGKYFFSGVEGETTPIVKIGVSLEKGQVSYCFFDQDVYDGINVNVTDGTYMSVTYGPLSIEPFRIGLDFELE